MCHAEWFIQDGCECDKLNDGFFQIYRTFKQAKKAWQSVAFSPDYRPLYCYKVLVKYIFDSEDFFYITDNFGYEQNSTKLER